MFLFRFNYPCERYFTCFGDIAFKFVILSPNIEMNYIPSHAVDETFYNSSTQCKI